MQALILASGSSGNACLVRSGDTSILFDAGISALAVRQRLAAMGSHEDEISAVFLSHEHSDHVRGLEVLLKRRQLPVWATQGTWTGVTCRATEGGELRSGQSLEVGGLTVLPVATSHDAREPVAFLVDDGEHRLALCTDTGIFTHLLGQRLEGCHVLLLETNHDPDLLRHGPYPWPLKQRIASRLGHLANHQAEAAVEKLASASLKAVVGLHLSEANNSADLVCTSLRSKVAAEVLVDAVPRGEMRQVTVVDGEAQITPVAVPPSGRKKAGG